MALMPTLFCHEYFDCDRIVMSRRTWFVLFSRRDAPRLCVGVDQCQCIVFLILSTDELPGVQRRPVSAAAPVVGAELRVRRLELVVSSELPQRQRHQRRQRRSAVVVVEWFVEQPGKSGQTGGERLLKYRKRTRAAAARSLGKRRCRVDVDYDQ
jgi:hypothetical protein